MFPIRVSLNSEPTMFSKLISWCHPAVTVFCQDVESEIDGNPHTSNSRGCMGERQCVVPPQPFNTLPSVALQRVVEVGANQVIDID